MDAKRRRCTLPFCCRMSSTERRPPAPLAEAATNAWAVAAAASEAAEQAAAAAEAAADQQAGWSEDSRKQVEAAQAEAEAASMAAIQAAKRDAEAAMLEALMRAEEAEVSRVLPACWGARRACCASAHHLNACRRLAASKRCGRGAC